MRRPSRIPPTLLVLAAFAAFAVSACFEHVVNNRCPADHPSVGDGGYCVAPGDMASHHDGPLPNQDMSTIPCKTNGDCSKSAATPFCGQGGVCVACLMTTDCTTAADPVCSNQMCTGCAGNSDCTRFTSTPLCNMGNGACVQCLTKSDCLVPGMTGKACSPTTNTCVPCTTNDECASGLCMSGACADPSTLVYVSAATCPATGQGTFQSPYCKIKDGLDKGVMLTEKVIIFGGTYTDAVALSPASGTYAVTAIGVGGPVLAPTTSNVAAFSVVGTGGATSVDITIDTLTIKNATGGNGQGVSCSGANGNNAATKLTLLRSTISNNAQNGVITSNCTITMDQDVVGPMNLQGGILLQSTDHTLQNVEVVGNGTSGSSATGGIQVTGSAGTAVIANSTIVANAKSGSSTPSGVTCASGTKFFNDVIYGNTGAASEIDTVACSPDHSAFAAATGTNFSTTTCATAAQLFDVSAAGLYVPKNPVTAPCAVGAGTTLVGIGVLSFSSVTAPTYDLTGATRPSPPAIGALE